MRLVEEERRTEAPPQPVNIILFAVSMLEVFGGISLILDLYSDILVTVVIYYASLDCPPEEVNDYVFALIICFVSLAATFMAT